MNLVRRFLLLIMLTAMCGDLLSQELQPRRWAALPVGVNFVALGTLWTYGDILFDPALLIEDAEVEILGVGAGYIRTFEMFDKQARIDAALPYANGRWSGLLDGEPFMLLFGNPTDVRSPSRTPCSPISPRARRCTKATPTSGR